MRILVFGTNTQKLKLVADTDYINNYTFLEDITDVCSTVIDYENEVIINEKYYLSRYHAVILNDTSAKYNYFWANAFDIPWFSNPFKIRNASNHNLHFATASYSGFKVPFGNAYFSEGKISVQRDFPKGEELSMLITNDIHYYFNQYPNVSRRFFRNCSRFLKNLNLSHGYAVFIKDSSDEFWLKSFSPIVDWDLVSEPDIEAFLKKVHSGAQIMARRNGHNI